MFIRKIIVLTILLVCSFTETFALTQSIGDEREKVILSKYGLKDPKVGHVTWDISNFIFRRRNGFKWPVTKVVFSKENDKLKLSITAIDNEWNKLIEKGENPHGYFVINNRIYVILKKEGCAIDFNDYFDPMEDGERAFFRTNDKTVMKNPNWIYTFDPDATFPRLLHSSNLEVLGK